MLDVKPFLEGMPLYRQVQAGIEDMIRANPRAKEIPLSDVRLAERPGAELVYVQRLRFQKETLVAIDDRYMRADCCPRLTTQDVRTSSLVDYLRNREGIEVDHGEMEIEARRAGQ